MGNGIIDRFHWSMVFKQPCTSTLFPVYDSGRVLSFHSGPECGLRGNVPYFDCSELSTVNGDSKGFKLFRDDLGNGIDN